MFKGVFFQKKIFLINLLIFLYKNNVDALLPVADEAAAAQYELQAKRAQLVFFGF